MLGKLKNYCTICKKQCKDENGLKMHISSSFHNKMKASYDPEKEKAKNSLNFERVFGEVYKNKYGTNNWVTLNKIYNELVHD